MRGLTQSDRREDLKSYVRQSRRVSSAPLSEKSLADAGGTGGSLWGLGLPSSALARGRGFRAGHGRAGPCDPRQAAMPPCALALVSAGRTEVAPASRGCWEH